MRRFAAVAVFVALATPLLSSQAAEVKVLSAIGMRQVMFELGPRFERATGYKLAITFDSTGVIAKRIAAGEQVDVVMINRSAFEPLLKDRRVIASSVTPIAASVAAVAVGKGAVKPDISSPAAFRRMLLSATSIARPSPEVGGSSGDHVVAVLQQLGIASEVDEKSVIITLGPDRIADSPGAAVAAGKADVALHQLQELMAVPGLEILGPFPGELQGNFVFSAALATNARAADGGKALIAFLQSPAARAVITAKGMQPIAPAPARAAIIAAATDIVQKAHYCTFITIGEDGQPQARIVDPLAPDATFTVWIATNPLTRKVDQLRRNPRATLSCFDSASSSYVTVLGRGELVSDVAEKQRHWKSDWSAVYPSGARGNDVVLIRFTPSRLEIVSESRGMIGDAKTWLPLSIDFPPQAAGEAGYVQTPDGARLFYRKAGDSRPAVVLLHGGPGSNINGVWPDLQPLGEGRTIVTYDQRGGGRSQIIKDPSQLTASHHVRDLEAVRRHLRLDKFTLMGESWGAGLAVLYAAEHPERVERLVLIGPMPPSRAIMNKRLDESNATMGLRKRLAEMAQRMPTAPDPVATCREFFGEYLKQFFADPAAMAKRRGSSCDGPPEGVRNYFVVNDATLGSLGDFDFRPILAKLKMPALVIEGEQSIPSTVESARVFAQSLPNATLALIPDAGHYPQVEQPDRFFPVVNRFLDRR